MVAELSPLHCLNFNELVPTEPYIGKGRERNTWFVTSSYQHC